MKPSKAIRDQSDHQNAVDLNSADTATLFQFGLLLHQQNRLGEAKKIYQKIHGREPDNPEVMHFLGLINMQEGQLETAKELIRASIRIRPNNYLAHVNLGATLAKSGEYEEALKSYNNSLYLNPNQPEVHSLLGKILHKLKRFEEAIASYNRTVTMRPDYADCFYNRGLALHELERYEEAIASYDQSTALNPDLSDSYYNRGIALIELKRFEEAIQSYRLAIAIRLDSAAYHYALGIALRKTSQLHEAISSFLRAIQLNNRFLEAYDLCGRTFIELEQFEAAVTTYEHAIKMDSQRAENYVGLGFAFLKLKKFEKALESFQQALAFDPNLAEAHSGLGNTLTRTNSLKDAEIHHDIAISLDPNSSAAYLNRGHLYKRLGRIQQAVSDYNQALSIDPESATARFAKAEALLLNGEFREGWELYESRWETSQKKTKKNLPDQLKWSGAEDVAGKTLLIHAEQGLGDTIQFCRYVHLLKEKGARVILEVPSSLINLLKTLTDVDEIIESSSPTPDFDYHCPLLSLPLAFRTEFASIPRSTPYLRVDRDKLRTWHDRLGEKTKPRIGLVWSGSATHQNDNNRSLSLAELIFNLPEKFDYSSLQREIRDSDKKALELSQIRRFDSELTDFTDTAALCKLMDLVISVDTSVAHLAGALAQPVWILLPHDPDWRWMLDRSDSPWYPTAKLFRRSINGDWTDVLDDVQTNLDAWRWENACRRSYGMYKP